MTTPFLLPRGADAKSQHVWAQGLVDALRREVASIKQTATTQTTDLSALQAEIDAIEEALNRLLAIFNNLDTDALPSQLAFLAELQADVNAIFAQTQADLDAALRAARRTAQSALIHRIRSQDDFAAIRVEQKRMLGENFALAQQIFSLEVQVGDASAAIIEERTVRIEKDEAFATQITSLQASIDDTLAQIDIEAITRVIDNQVAQATLITTLQSQIGGQAASITQLLETTGGHSSRWSIAISSQGNVQGLVTLSGTGSTTTFGVVADKFFVAQPTEAGTPKQVFGMVQPTRWDPITNQFVNVGTTQLGIRADVLVDGSITAAKLVVANLQAIAGDLGTLTTGRIRSPDGKFDINLSGSNRYIRITS